MAQADVELFQQFDEEKLYRDIFRACLSGLNDEQKCHNATEDVLETVASWAEGRNGVEAWQIRDRVVEELESLGAGIAYFYQYNSYVDPGR